VALPASYMKRKEVNFRKRPVPIPKDKLSKLKAKILFIL
jgi:hypothetical protein